MNYIGSKRRLLQDISTVLSDCDLEYGLALDLFAGTGVVSGLLKKMGFRVFANDWQSYSYSLVLSQIGLNDFPTFDRLFLNSEWAPVLTAYPRTGCAFRGKSRDLHACEGPFQQVIHYLQGLSDAQGLFWDAYCEGGSQNRQYFSSENGAKIQAIRDQIQDWFGAGLLCNDAYHWLLACVIESADQVANTASVYGSYLKQVKASARRPFVLHAVVPVPSNAKGQVSHQVFCDEGLRLLDQQKSAMSDWELTYLDPPYNQRQYSANYHVLETIAKWDLSSFRPRGITGLRPGQEKMSYFCKKRRYLTAFQHLFDAIESRYILFSYNSEGLLSDTEIESLFAPTYQIVQFQRKPYQRFKSDQVSAQRAYKENRLCEYLVLGQRKFD